MGEPHSVTIKRPGRKLVNLARNLQWLIAPDAAMRADRAAMEALRDRHRGQPALVIGNGPSLNNQDLTRIGHFVSIGANSYFLKSQVTGVHPDYLTVEDPLPAEDNAEALRAFSGSIKIAARDLEPIFGRDAGYTYVNFVRGYQYLAGPRFPFFSLDCARGAFWGGTVIYMNLQLAAYMGCNPIYLTGMDLSYQIPDSADIEGSVITSREDDPNHFDPTYFGAGKRWHVPHTDRMQACISKAYRRLDANGIELYNATQGGNLRDVPRRSFEDALAMHPLVTAPAA